MVKPNYAFEKRQRELEKKRKKEEKKTRHEQLKQQGVEAESPNDAAAAFQQAPSGAEPAPVPDPGAAP